MRRHVAFGFAFTCIVAISSGAADARPARSLLVATPPECNVTMPCDFSGSNMRTTASRLGAPREGTGRVAIMRVATVEGTAQVVGGRPTGCPRSFCGCAAAIRVFGHIVPGLNLAANWLRFPRTSPAPGMVAARHGHVFVLEQHVGGDVWMAYDGNSGGRATRIHARSLRGYVVVNPRVG
ncbi:hypothetical protein [Bradyrhizobium sp. CCBAU 45389]|uniref:hypothetical protein n=1 Tax=Bradyrhizobium sp. CCBAU 45389 TaxID=858429 RepID=UPI0023060473|nr:hypothetical protein [Bradyrhizobium sp. CCBAU 45389]MDA9402727.1 hypothetical protein [Bradyrhizobium sp. CCBAU 45389]